MAVVMETGWLSADDYLGYWAAGEVSLKGGNPYDPTHLVRLQNELGWPEDEAVIMWSPPWTLPLAISLSIFPYPLSRTLWLAINVILVFISANTLWKFYGGSERLRWVSWLLGFTFLPVLDAIKKGQTGILNLLGVVGFLYFINAKKPWLAGFSLVLLTVKPHTTYLFLLGVLLWGLYKRAWQIMVGFLSALSALTLIAWVINPNVIEQYLFAVRHYPPSDWLTPTVGGMLRLLLGPEKFWLQFLLPFLGVIWLVVYWIRRRDNWNWLEEAPLLVLVSIVTAAYGWSFDQPVVLVAIMQIFALITIRKWDLASGLFMASYILINLLDLASPPNEIWLWWLGPSLLLWYLISRWFMSQKTRCMTIANT